MCYKGTRYHGWQLQQNAHSIQAELNRVLEVLLKEPIETTGSGRTDAGVHALQQVIHFDVNLPIAQPGQFVYRLNALLPEDMAIKGLYQVPEQAHARFDALSRSYQYHILTSKNPFEQDLSYFFPHPLDLGQMNAAATLLLTHTDLQCFSKAHTDVHNYHCQVSRAYWEPKPGRLVFHISANRFLRGMVRAVVGTLLEVGQGRRSLEDLEALIVSQDRKKAGRNVPPEGLFLTEVVYPDYRVPLTVLT
jgi:tRNA pseudouridine38-40 synthase